MKRLSRRAEDRAIPILGALFLAATAAFIVYTFTT
jgi:hypothetical protein